MRIPGGVVVLGPRNLTPVGGWQPPPMPAPSPSPTRTVGPDRHAGAPPAFRPPPQPETTGPAVPWRSDPGRDLEPRRVRVRPFEIDRTEVTRAQYRRFLLATGYKPPYVDEDWARDGGWNWNGTDYPAGTANHPVVLVSWYDAREYCRWMHKRLPTEAEWQLAALGPAGGGPDGRGRLFPWGDDYRPKALNHGRIEGDNFDASDGYRTTSPVGSFPAGRSPFGLLDAFGNAWEFTSDWRVDGWNLVEGQREGDLIVDPKAPGPGLYVAVRGGSYYFDFRPNPGGERHAFLAEIRRKTSGFRCAR